MAGKSPVSSVIGVLALLVLGALILYGVQTLSRSMPGNGPVQAARAAGTVELHSACAGSDAAAVSERIKAGADVNAIASGADAARAGMTPLMVGCIDGNDAIVRALLDAGAKTELRTDDGRTALMFAAGWGDAGKVQALLDAGARVDSRTTDGRTALMWAAHRGEPGSVQAILAAGADVNATNKWRQTALMAAAGSGSVEKVRALLDAGAEVNASDQRGETALHAAAAAETQAEIITLLVTRGGDVNAADADGVTPLMKAAERADAAQVQSLLAAGASRSAKDRINGWTAQDWAAKRDDERGRAVAAILAAGNP